MCEKPEHQVRLSALLILLSPLVLQKAHGGGAEHLRQERREYLITSYDTKGEQDTRPGGAAPPCRVDLRPG